MTDDKKKNINYIKSVTKILKSSKNELVDLDYIKSDIVSNVPVLIDKLIVKLSIDKLVKLPENAININSVKNKLIIKSCKFIQEENCLFIKGIVSKKIYYNSKAYANLRHYNINIPFEYTTKIISNKLKISPLSNNDTTDIKHFKKSNLSSESKLIPNKPPFFQLISSKINEHYKYVYDKNSQKESIDIKEVKELNINMIVLLEFEIFQNKEIYIKYSSNDNKNSCFNKNIPLEDNINSKNKFNINNETTAEKNQESNDLPYYSKEFENKLFSIDNPKPNNDTNINDEVYVKNNPSLDFLCNKCNYNNKLDLSYLLDFYNEPKDDPASINNTNIDNSPNVSNLADIKSNTSSEELCNKYDYNNRLDLSHLLNFYYNSHNGNELYSLNEAISHGFSSYKSLILFLCLLILCANNN
ncbi:hypothetical protein [Maledivibacter halophilus]|uniref:Uncharacterized protein n=1 Tax=Maledivibacter halophilus TaxID=36842 RepID=A0A1T5MLP2_9FIRM|nr:hypothetical protein [Maledivibacter halophilus]SKC88973.1 hypothetical protein SAMN02194393_04959 [Maledivibacter halophilus]